MHGGLAVIVSDRGKSLRKFISMPLIHFTTLRVSVVGEIKSFVPSLVEYTAHIDRNV